MKIEFQRQRPRCPRCHIGGYRESKAADGRPEFKCTRCDHTWTSGLVGGIYAGQGIDNYYANKREPDR